MPFQAEPIHYVKGALSDLHGAWSCLRDTVVNLPPSEIQHRLISHIDEGMSGESVRNLEQKRENYSPDLKYYSTIRSKHRSS